MSNLLKKYNIEDLLGKEFEWGVNDCYTLCVEVLGRNGIKIPIFNDKPNETKVYELYMKYNKYFKRHEIPQPLSIVALKVNYPFVTHFGVCLEYPYFIHVMQKRNVCLERLDSLLWKGRIDGYYTYEKS